MQNRNPEDIKADVRKTGISLAELARKHGLDDSTTRAALRRPQPSGNRAIAKHLGKSLHDLWPEWFNADGDRISGPKTTRKSRPAASQKRSPKLTRAGGALALRRAST